MVHELNWLGSLIDRFINGSGLIHICMNRDP